MNISQPAVSVTIRELEEYYGFKLFDRVTRKLYITPEGKEIYDYTSRILLLLDEMSLMAESLKQRRTLRIGTGINLGELFMSKIAKQFGERNRDIKLLMSVNSAPIIEQKLINNELDLVIIGGNIHNKDNLERQLLQEQPMIAICRKDSPLVRMGRLTLTDIAAQDFLLGERISDLRVMVEDFFAANNLPISPIWESASTIALVNAVGEGLGVSVMPLNFVQAIDNHNIVILNVEGLDLKWHINIVFHRQKQISQEALYFIEFCRNAWNSL
jgi:DNA-binding transcriptional LysR family regulator